MHNCVANVNLKMRGIVGLDVGPAQSAYCTLATEGDGFKIGCHEWIDNCELLHRIRGGRFDWYVVILESPQAQDRPLGKLLRDTIWWAARFAEAIDFRTVEWDEAEERDVALWLTGNRNASNAAILQSLKDVFGDKRQVPCAVCNGSGKVAAVVGKLKGRFFNCKECRGRGFTTEQGALHGLNEHERSALACAWWHWKRTQDRKATA